MAAPRLQIQTVYAELLERAAADAFDQAFSEEGDFVRKTVKGRFYWYFQSSTPEGRIQKYVGPETSALLERISLHKDRRSDVLERRALVSTLIRSFGMQRPQSEIGAIVQSLGRAGAFRLRGVIVGTVAFQTYAPMLGVPLQSSHFQTEDVDIAQFRNVSVAVEDQTHPMIDVLKELDASFRPVPHFSDGRKVTRYQAKGGMRVDFLTPNEGADTGKPERLPALNTDAEPLRFLDFLIRDPEPAVILHDAGVFVLVPSPQRFAVHKMIVSRRRSAGNPKRDKDIRQSEALIEILVERRPSELIDAWEEAFARGPVWSQLLLDGLASLAMGPRDRLLKLLHRTRAILPKLDLEFNNSAARYDFDRDVVLFEGTDTLGGHVICAISREALEDHFGADNLDQKGRLQKFQQNRSTIERLARQKYLERSVEEIGKVLIKTENVSNTIEAK